LDCRHLENSYELFLLDTLSEDESLHLREHLSQGCEHCEERLREAARTVYVLSLTAKPVSPAPKIKAELLRKVRNQ
jgi:hypothetical protein